MLVELSQGDACLFGPKFENMTPPAAYRSGPAQGRCLLSLSPQFVQLAELLQVMFPRQEAVLDAGR